MLPSRITLNHSFQVSLNVGNEFGLFKRDYIPEGEKIHLVAKLRNNPQDMFYLDQEDETTCKLQNDGKKEYKFSLNERGKASFQAVIRLKKHAIPVEEDFDGISIMVCVHSDSKERWNLLSVVSLPFTVAICSKNSEKKVIEGKPSELGVHCCRAFQLEGINHEIILAESPGTLGIGGKLWDSSLVLTRYLYLHRLELIGKRVIELGSGTGLVGMFCALLGAKEVTLSDIQVRLIFSTTQSE
jgi:hypothetical protein